MTHSHHTSFGTTSGNSLVGITSVGAILLMSMAIYAKGLLLLL